MDLPIKPFKIQVPEPKLVRLQRRLEFADFSPPSPLLDDWQFGAPVSEVERLAKYWQNGYNWRATESRLNKLPQFTTLVPVDGFGDVQVHFVHVKADGIGSIPLLICHGWPGSFLEMAKTLPLLTREEGGLAFDVVAPSLPNFGFSQGITKPGFRPPQYAEALHKLMLKLGYDKYDWGFTITRYMGILYPDHCLASHFNLIWSDPPSLFKNPLQYLRSLLPLSKEEKDGLDRTMWFSKECTGYSALQNTRPATLGIAWMDSPVALLVWIYEKLHDWTEAYPWTDDEILDWVSIYEFSTAGAHASARIYYEMNYPSPLRETFQWVPSVKLGLSYFPKDVALPRMCYGRTLGPVVFDVWHENGGHIAAHERPEVLVGDVRRMFGQGGGAHDVVKAIGQGT